MRDSRRGAEITMQSMSGVLGRWHRLLHVRTLLERWYNRKQEVHLVCAGFVLHPELFHKKGPATRSQVREGTWMQSIPHGKSTSKEVSQEEIWQHPRQIHQRQVLQKNDDWVESLWRDHPWDGSACKQRPQSYCHTRRDQCLPWQLVDPLECGEFRSIRCRQGVNLISRKHCRHCTAWRKRRTRSTMKIGHKVPPHGGNGRRTGVNPIKRIHHKDGVTTDWTGKPVYSVRQLFICCMNLSNNWMHNLSWIFR